jgi:hypothetical protein
VYARTIVRNGVNVYVCTHVLTHHSMTHRAPSNFPCTLSMCTYSIPIRKRVVRKSKMTDQCYTGQWVANYIRVCTYVQAPRLIIMITRDAACAPKGKNIQTLVHM